MLRSLAGRAVVLASLCAASPALAQRSASEVPASAPVTGVRYEVTAEDPEVLAEPWVLTPRMLRLNPNKDAGLLPEATPCRDYDHDNMVTQIRH